MITIHEDHNGVRTATQEKKGAPDGASWHFYSIFDPCSGLLAELHFQEGPIPEVGVNGITNEALLAIVAHRLKHLDAIIPCEENKAALANVQAAQDFLMRRTKERMARGVEGTHAA